MVRVGRQVILVGTRPNPAYWEGGSFSAQLSPKNKRHVKKVL